MNEATPTPVEREPSPSVPAALPLTPLSMLERALNQGAGIDVLERLMALHERWELSEARRQFNEAMAEAKVELPIVLKNRQVGFTSKKEGAARTSYKHEDLAEIVRTVAPILAKHGLSHRFRTSSEPNEPISVTCIISHRAGHSEENTLRAGRDDSQSNMNSLQRIGSTITYLQRYALKAALGLAAAEDDDATAIDITPITPEQAANLQKQLRDAGIRFDRFCDRFGVNKVEELTVEQLQPALDAIAAYVAQREAKS